MPRASWTLPLLIAGACFQGSGIEAVASQIRSPSQTAVNAAVSAPLIRYWRVSGGAPQTNGAWFGGASVTLAVASHAGNTTADARLLEQMRLSITGGSEICANGGYPAQHERHVTGMFAIAKHTPRIWSQLSEAERQRIDLVMEAALVASAFTTSDSNPYILANTTQRTLDGDSNLGRDWNPNYREGMIGGLLVGMAYFGGPSQATALLDGYDHPGFLARLQSHGLSNLYQTFNWKVANPSSAAPTGTMIRDAVRNFRFRTMRLADHQAIYQYLVNDTYGKSVNPGLNNGAGINGAGRINAGADQLPHRGFAGMLKEFDSTDGSGLRSSIHYSYDGYRTHQTNQLVLVVCGYWQHGTAAARDAVRRIRTGNIDLYYKIRNGYTSYANGGNQGAIGLTGFNRDRGYAYVAPLWNDVLAHYHYAGRDHDGDGSDDFAEIRLGLDPHDGRSAFRARLAGGKLIWPGAAGISFKVQRGRAAAGGIAWSDLATVTGADGPMIFTDPSPPPGHAFYRLAFEP